MDVGAIATAFGVVFLGELPDKTMFATLVMASRGRAGLVWLGSASAFLLHVVIAVTVGAGLLRLLPDRLVEAIVALLFLGGAIYVFRSAAEDESHDADRMAEPASDWRRYATAFGVVFLAEWGDLTQVLTANLTARFEAPLSVGLGALLALWAVTGIAVVGGQGLVRLLPLRLVRRITAVILFILAVLAAAAAIRG